MHEAKKVSTARKINESKIIMGFRHSSLNYSRVRTQQMGEDMKDLSSPENQLHLTDIY